MHEPDPVNTCESPYSILQVFNKYLQYGGEEQSVERIRNQLSEQYSLNSCSFDSEDWVSEDAPMRISQVLRMFYNPVATRQLTDSIQQTRPNMILLHNLYPVGSPGIYKTALQHDVPVIQYIHNFRPFSVGGTLWASGRLCEKSLHGNYWDEVRLGAWQSSVLKSAIFATVLKFLHSTGWLSAVKGWIAISRFMHDKFIEAGIDPSTIHVLPHAWDMQTAANEQGRDDGYYVFLGRLVEEKGVDVLLEAWRQLGQELGERAPELWIGGNGPLADAVRHAAERSDKIRYLGFVDGPEKRDILRNCRAMLAPSMWWEPLGLVTYESYDYKKPMFAASSGGLSETVDHGRTGYLHKAGDAQQLALQILAFENLSGPRRLEMGREGRRWLEQNANPDDWHDRIRQIFDLTLRGNHG
jgi:glycosyltransferase involved in cell wall biosynthesis